MSKKSSKKTGVPDEGLVGDMVRRYREARGQTQHELGIESGMAAAAISNIECGRIRSPRLETIQRLEKALGASLRVENGPEDSISAKYVKKSLNKFLASPMAKSLKLNAKEVSELGELKWFNPKERPSDMDWADWIRLRRRVREINGG